MKNNRNLLVLFFSIFLSASTYSQSPSQPIVSEKDQNNTGEKGKEEFVFKRFTFSSGYALSISGASNEMKVQMETSGFNDAKYRRGESLTWVLLFPINLEWDEQTQYPIVDKKGGFFNFDLGFYFTQNHGVVLNYAGTHEFTIQGFEEVEQMEYHYSSGLNWEDSYYNNGNYLSIKMESQAMFLAYVYSIFNQRLNFVAGPSLQFQKLETSTQENLSENCWGAVIGINGQVHQGKWWYINLFANYRWFQKIEIGPYSVSRYNQQGELHTTTFNKIHLNLSSLQLGIGVGVRL